MKKSLLLIPSLVALTATPFVGLTSCTIGGGDTPEPTPPEPEGAIELNTMDEYGCIMTSKTISVQAGETVTFTIHFKNFADYDTDHCLVNSFSTDYSEDHYFDEAYFKPISVTFDNNVFTMDDTDDYWLECVEGDYTHYCDLHSPQSFSNYTLGTFVVTFYDEYSDFHPYFQIGT